MSAIKVVIYDCDGVLFDSKKANEVFYNHILEKFGRPPMGPQQLKYVHMSSGADAVNYLFRGDPLREAAQQYRLSLDYEPFLKFMVEEPDALRVLACLKERVKRALCTNRTNTVELILDKKGLRRYFEMVVSAKDVGSPKPEPDMVFKILEHFRIKGDQALFIGDSPVDKEVARRAGVSFVSYKNPDLESEHHIRNHMDLLKILSLYERR